MSTNKPSNNGYSKKIMKLLAQKPAIAIPELMALVSPQKVEKTSKMAISRSIRGLSSSGLIEQKSSGNEKYARLTQQGKRRLYSIRLEHDGTLVDPSWDGSWRIVMLDMPENRKDERDALRYLLKKAGFVCLKNSVWISPLPYENLFTNIKKDFSLTTELMIFVTNNLDPETEKSFFELIK